MLTSRIIPCLDVCDNRVVKGVKFAGLRVAGNPAELAKTYAEQGADEIVVLDVSATDRREKTQLQTVREVREAIAIPLTVGGGVRIVDDVQRLTDAGADRVSINTAAVARPELIEEMASRFGTQCTVVAIDARRVVTELPLADPPVDPQWEVVTHAGKRSSRIDVIQWARRAENYGAGEILLTSFDRDGTREGYDCDLLTAVTGAVSIPVIASGGANSASHMVAGFEAGASAVLAASIFHDGDLTVEQLKVQLREQGQVVRL